MQPSSLEPSQTLSFFKQLAPHLNGQCMIRFRVGEPTIENQVALNGTEYRVHNNFVPFDIDTYVADAKKRVRTEQERANFTDELTDVYFIPAEPCWHGSRQCRPSTARLAYEKSKGKLSTSFRHPWLATHHADPDGRHLALVRNMPDGRMQIRSTGSTSRCLPQRPRNAQDETRTEDIAKISTIQSKGPPFAIVEGDYSHRHHAPFEHFAAVLFSLRDYTGVASSIDYAGDD